MTGDESTPASSGRRVRLQRLLADAGIAARRECERLIETGHVTVNHERVDRLPVFVDPDQDHVEVDGRPVKALAKHFYLMWHKPSRVLATPPIDEHEGRPTVADYVDHPTAPRLFPVGTLAFESTGLMLLTSDTRAASLLVHPRSSLERVYHARVKGQIDAATARRLKKGVVVLDRVFEPEAEEPARRKEMTRSRPRPASRPAGHRVRLEVRPLDPHARTISPDEPVPPPVRGELSAANSSIEIITTEARDDHVAQALQLVGHPVRKMSRISLGPLRLREIGPGAWRELKRDEMRSLRSLIDSLEKGRSGKASGQRSATGSRAGGEGGRASGSAASRGPGVRKPRTLVAKKPSEPGAPTADDNASRPGTPVTPRRLEPRS